MTFEFSVVDALSWCTRGLGFAVLQQSAESLRLSRAFSAFGLWCESANGLNVSLRKAQLAIHAARAILGGHLVLWGPSWAIVVVGVLTVLSLAPTRGTLNGGSDNMTLMLAAGLSVAWLGRNHALGVLGGLYFIAIQAAFSYFVAGVAKLKEPCWRDGSVLRGIATGGRYGVPSDWLTWAERSSSTRMASPLIIAFECSFPLALVEPTMGVLFCAFGVAFHALNAFLLGLHRFWPVWLATYPAILFVGMTHH